MINLRNCEFGFKCNANWDEMTVSEDQCIRHCELCKKDVYYVSQPEELMEAIQLNRCVAIYDFNTTMRPTLGKVSSYDEIEEDSFVNPFKDNIPF
jgi:hypothetical protein